MSQLVFCVEERYEVLVVRFNYEFPSEDMIWKFSQAQVAANASFSIWEYLLSVGVMDVEAYATGFHSPSVHCSSTAPNLKDEASAENFTSTLGSYSVKIVSFTNYSLMQAKALSCSGPQSQACFKLSSSRNGVDNSAMLDENFPSWLTRPRNLLRSDTVLGASILYWWL